MGSLVEESLDIELTQHLGDDKGQSAPAESSREPVRATSSPPSPRRRTTLAQSPGGQPSSHPDLLAARIPLLAELGRDAGARELARQARANFPSHRGCQEAADVVLSGADARGP